MVSVLIRYRNSHAITLSIKDFIFESTNSTTSILSICTIEAINKTITNTNVKYKLNTGL